MLKTAAYDTIISYKMGRSIGGFVPSFVHSFLLGDTLIDTGTPYAGAEFLSAIERKQINKVINTHHHEDHIGNNHSIQHRYSAEIFAHRDAIPYIKNPRNIKLRFYQRMVWGYPEGSDAHEIGESIAIGQYKFTVIDVQGHAKGHICLYEPRKKWLFTGDMFCGIKNTYLRQDEDFNLTLASLGNLSKLTIDTIFCSLKGVVNNGGEALSKKIAYMKDLRDRSYNLHEAGLSTIQIRNKLLGREDVMFYMTGGHFSKRFLIASILGG